MYFFLIFVRYIAQKILLYQNYFVPLSPNSRFMKKTGIKTLIWTLAGIVLLGGCQALEKKQQVGAVAELNGHYLYRSTLDSLSLGMDSIDSARVTDQYIRQWAQDILLYDNSTARTNEHIEQMVSDYRRTLYAQAYEERLIDKRMSKKVADSAVVALYEQMPERFKLNESIMQGVLVIVPKDAPNVPKLRQWLIKMKSERMEARIEEQKVKADNRKGKKELNVMDEIEKYVYQNASGYELFTDKWLTTTEMMSQIPLERAELENKLRYTDRIEVADSARTYILQITDKHMRGEAMPIDYARPEIEKIVLNARQVEFLRSERERMYEEAIQTKKLNFFQTENGEQKGEL